MNPAQNRKIALFALIAAAGLALGGCTGPDPFPDACMSGAVTGDFTSLLDSWQGVLALAVLVTFLFSAMVFMVSGLFAHRGLIVWSRNQMYEGFATLVLAILAVSIVGVICSVDVGIFSAQCVDTSLVPGYYDDAVVNGSCNFYDVAQFYLQAFSNLITNGFYFVLLLNLTFSAIASVTLSLAPNGIGPTISIGPGLSTITQGLTTAIIAVATAQILTMAQIMVLKIASKLFGVLLVAGILLRGFGLTRGFGGALIALAFGLYFIYPLSVVLVYGTLMNDMTASVETLAGIESIPTNPVEAGVTSPSGDISNGLKDAIATIVGPVCGFVSMLALGVVFAPFIVFIMLVSFVKGLSAILGEEMDVSNLTRLV